MGFIVFHPCTSRSWLYLKEKGGNLRKIDRIRKYLKQNFLYLIKVTPKKDSPRNCVLLRNI